MLIHNSLLAYNYTPQTSFGAMKKSQFDGIDYAVVEKFKAPIEKFDSNQNFQVWSDIQLQNILNKEYSGRKVSTASLREDILKDWTEVLSKEKYSSATKLLVLKSITKELKPNNDKLPPDYNQEAFNSTMQKLRKALQSDRNFQFDFNKIYTNEKRNLSLKNFSTSQKETNWVIIPSYKHDKENFKKNTELLKTLSDERWCTKNRLADTFLRTSDFHILLKGNNPKLVLRYENETITEIQGGLNNGTIPQNYINELETYIRQNDLKVVERIQTQIDDAKEKAVILKEMKFQLKDSIKDNDIENIFRYLGFACKTNLDGSITLNNGYFQPMKGISWKDLGIDENKLLENVQEINGYCDFSHSDATSLGAVTKINGHLKLSHSKLTDLGNLEYVENINLSESKIKSLGKLRIINGNANFSNSILEDLGNLNYIGKDADFSNSRITSLGNLEYIGGEANFKDTQITSSGNLKEIGKFANFANSNIQILPQLERIGGNAKFAGSKIQNLGALTEIGGYADFCNTDLTSLGQLRKIQGLVILRQTPLTTLGNLEYIGDNISFTDTNINNLGNLRYIGGNATFSNSKVKSLNNLREIGGNADFSNSDIENFGNLRVIGGNAIFDENNVPYRPIIHIAGNVIKRPTYHSNTSSRNQSSTTFVKILKSLSELVD